MNILAIDQGTSATKALLVGPGNEVLGRAEVPVATTAVGADGVEADPEELWSSVVSAGARALAAARAPAHVPVHAVALANQGETVLAWDKASGRPLSRAIVWQDRRSAGICERLEPCASDLRRITGLPLDPYFAAPKMKWLRENVTAGGVITTTDSWLLHRLGTEYVTDAATASRTMLLDLDAVRWSDPACAAFGIAPEALPRVAGCAEVVGETTAFTDRALPIAGIAVDQQAALFAHGCVRAGDAKCTYGTGAFLLVTTGEKAARSSAGLSASVAWRLHDSTTYCLDGQVYTAGSALRWLTEIGVLPRPADLDPVAGAVKDSGGVTFVPALAGLGAPHWAPQAKGQLTGLTLATNKGHIARAVAEGIAASVAVLAAAVAADLGRPLTALRVDGGLTRSRVLLQAQADLLQVPVLVSRTPDATALGVAALARRALGEAAQSEVAQCEVAQCEVAQCEAAQCEAAGSPPAEVELIVHPVMTAAQSAERMAGYHRALTSCLS